MLCKLVNIELLLNCFNFILAWKSRLKLTWRNLTRPKILEKILQSMVGALFLNCMAFLFQKLFKSFKSCFHIFACLHNCGSLFFWFRMLVEPMASNMLTQYLDSSLSVHWNSFSQTRTTCDSPLKTTLVSRQVMNIFNLCSCYLHNVIKVSINSHDFVPVLLVKKRQSHYMMNQLVCFQNGISLYHALFHRSIGKK